MSNLNLPLFEQKEVLAPIESNTSYLEKSGQCFSSQPRLSNSFDSVLSSIFLNQNEETRVFKTRRILGNNAKDLSNEDLEVLNSNLQYLIDVWLEMFEKQIFRGRTLSDVLGEN